MWTAAAPRDEPTLTAFAQTLSPEERQRAEQFSLNEPRREFVFGRALLRQLLGACLNVEPATLMFGYEQQGKPFLQYPTLNGGLHFNLSHSRSLVAIALASGRKVGVDIEHIHKLQDWQQLAMSIFSPRELCELNSLPEPQQRDAFFYGWTRKEAYLKATGEGLIDELQAIEVTLATGKEPGIIGLPAGLEAARWWAIRAIPLPPGFAGAVVFATGPR
ncbi:MAG: 4'-phosphopantetheinyl transferase superfamily protein [Verrucomicrobiota bacterium]